MAIIGIDLGTTHSLVAVYKDGKSRLIPNSFGEYLTPSVVSIDDNGNIIVGKLAKERLFTHPKATVACFKRYMGTDHIFHLNGYDFTAEELSSFVIKKLVEDARNVLNEDIEEAIISVPAYFSDDMRWATKAAGDLAGIKVERLVNEPTSAALAIYQHIQDEMKCMVLDFGGGTFDVSVVDAFDNIVEIVAVAGDNHLGGEDFNEAIMVDFLMENHLLKTDLTPNELSQLMNRIEVLKRQLDTEDFVNMSIIIGKQNYSYQLTYEHFKDISEEILYRLEVPIVRALKDADETIDEITQIVLVGGSMKMRLVQEHVQQFLKQSGEILVNPDEAIALGCGYVAGMKARHHDLKEMLLSDICPFTLGTDAHDPESHTNYFVPIIERNTLLPCSREEMFYTSKIGQKKVEVSIYQGENRNPEKNIFLGKLRINVPYNAFEHESVLVRYTYDINGLLEVDVTTSDHHKETLLIVSKKNRMTQNQINKRLEELSSLKIHPRDKEKNQYILERANRLFSETTKEKRQFINEGILYFEQALNSQDENKIDKAYQTLENALNDIENKDGKLLS